MTNLRPHAWTFAAKKRLALAGGVPTGLAVALFGACHTGALEPDNVDATAYPDTGPDEAGGDSAAATDGGAHLGRTYEGGAAMKFAIMFGLVACAACSETVTSAADGSTSGVDAANDAGGPNDGSDTDASEPYDAGPPPPGEVVRENTVSHWGVTWTFAEAASVGRFVNGDYYVVGPVRVMAIDPPPSDGRNGSVLNLPPEDSRSGFDSRVSEGRYAPELRVEPPFDMEPGDTLASSISVETVGGTGWILRPEEPNISPVKSVSLLTCVAQAPPADAFRPSYCDRDQKIYRADDLRRELLPSLPRVATTPPISEYVAYFERPWIDTVQFNFDAPGDYMPAYGRENARAVGMASLLLMLDFSAEEKERLLIAFVQYGIDLYGIVAAGHPGWPPLGGHGNGRKWPILFAGWLLQDDAMLHPPGRFSEDEQTYYGDGWTGADALFAFAGPAGYPGHIGWGGYEHLEPSDWEAMIGENYRRCCTSAAFVGESLAARLLGANAAWGAPAFFDYVDRWMTQDDTDFVRIIGEQTGTWYADWAWQRKSWDPFVDELWAAYRAAP